MKANRNFWVGAALLAGVLGFGLYGMASSLASGGYRFMYEGGYDDDDDERGYDGRINFRPPSVYNEECGSCHMPYPAMLLPSQSWLKIMSGLEDHFGESAELEETGRKLIETYLLESSNSGYYRGYSSRREQLPLRVTELSWFRHKHDKIPSSFIRENDNVSSFSQCNACHKNAEQGDFDEDNISIPGIGRWDD